MTAVLNFEGVTCNYAWDITSDFVQSGSSLTGVATAVGRGINCSIPLPSEVLAVFNGQSGSANLTGTANNGALTFGGEGLSFMGTYTNTRIDATAVVMMEGLTFNYTWRQTKQ
jgi:hypothetical protein